MGKVIEGERIPTLARHRPRGRHGRERLTPYAGIHVDWRAPQRMDRRSVREAPHRLACNTRRTKERILQVEWAKRQRGGRKIGSSRHAAPLCRLRVAMESTRRDGHSHSCQCELLVASKAKAPARIDRTRRSVTSSARRSFTPPGVQVGHQLRKRGQRGERKRKRKRKRRRAHAALRLARTTHHRRYLHALLLPLLLPLLLLLPHVAIGEGT